MDTLREVVIDEARWPRMFAKLRRAGMYRSCGCAGCGSCQSAARRLVRGLVRIGPLRPIEVSNMQMGRYADVRRQLGDRTFGFRVKPLPVPTIFDLSVSSGTANDSDPAESVPDLELRGPIYALIRWSSRLPLSSVISGDSRFGGVYVLVNESNVVLKAGSTNSFSRRAGEHQDENNERDNPFKAHSMYLGTITTRPRSMKNPMDFLLNIETALTRTLLRLNLPRVRRGARALPWEKSSRRTAQRVEGNIVIDGLLPRGVANDVLPAYTGAPPADASPTRLILRSAQSDWEQ